MAIETTVHAEFPIRCPGPKPTPVFLWIHLILCAACATVSPAQPPRELAPIRFLSTSPPGTFDLDADRQSIVSLDGPWRFHPGDDPAWADPNFDDSTWPLFYPQKPWPEHKFSGSAWFRAKIRVPANFGPVSMYARYIDDSFQIFANGQFVVSAGGLPPHPKAYGVKPTVVPLPIHLPADQPYGLVLAVRVWLWPDYANIHPGGITPGSRIGSPALIQRVSDAQTTQWAWGMVSQIFLAILDGLAAFTALVLFAYRRKETEYLWFALLLLCYLGSRCYATYYQFHTLGVLEEDLVYGTILTFLIFAEIAFYFRLLGGRRNWFFWITVACSVSLLLLEPLIATGVISITQEAEIVAPLAVPELLWVLVLLVRRSVQGYPDARLLIAPVLFSKATNISNLVSWVFYANGHSLSNDWMYHTLSWPFDLSLDNIGDFLFLIGMLAVLIHRFTRTRLHEETYEREREAARTVQQLLIPETHPAIPGFEITSVYKPASEVSGDFFQILALEKGGTLIAIGDVSGKGLPAALMVSLLVGTFRQAADSCAQPAEILAALNRRLHERSSGGFTTCLILRADPDGKLTMANAGHLSPYIDGEELPLDSGLPLGILPNAIYAELTHPLAPGHSITLLTDGVVEARNTVGELFGFERTQSISRRSAREIAQTAQSFGQDDDITVLKLCRL